MSDTETNKITDESNDHNYFVITPRIVWALCRDPYDYALWSVIKDIAGEKGECKLSTEDLATLAMMSAGKVSESRKYLIEAGLLTGSCYKEAGYSNPVWHLAVPDLWRRNIRWAEQYSAIDARLQHKDLQRTELKAARQTPSPHEGTPPASPGEEPPSPHGGTPSPHEEPPSPGETKKNIENIQEEEPKEDARTRGKIPPSLHPPDGLPDPQLVWDQTAGMLALEMSRATFQTWVQPLTPTGWHGSTLRVAAANQYGRDWVESRINSVTTRILRGITNRSDVAVEFYVRGV
jgi:hypothetical protein